MRNFNLIWFWTIDSYTDPNSLLSLWWLRERVGFSPSDAIRTVAPRQQRTLAIRLRARMLLLRSAHAQPSLASASQQKMNAGSFCMNRTAVSPGRRTDATRNAFAIRLLSRSASLNEYCLFSKAINALFGRVSTCSKNRSRAKNRGRLLLRETNLSKIRNRSVWYTRSVQKYGKNTLRSRGPMISSSDRSNILHAMMMRDFNKQNQMSSSSREQQFHALCFCWRRSESGVIINAFKVPFRQQLIDGNLFGSGSGSGFDSSKCT